MAVEIDFEFLAGELGKLRSDVMELKEPRPIYRPVLAAATVSSSPTVIVAQTPVPPGRFFEITCFGAYTVNAANNLPDLHTAVSGATVDFYAGPSAGVDSPGDVASSVGSSTTGVTTWLGDKKAFAHQGDKLYAWVYGITTATIVVIKFAAFDWRVENRVEMSI